ncbi:MAG: hypothetical protein JRH13_14000 [Deltaproteobacteria bacterium]|nr:hypothetical protein [Deltaproteobacteria bacterium]MBW2130464.1 hypothetical protein [Deltaproteobacteria bacterium]MBW2305094.1 hypothetical protein [Deltaproteobacteria bacterium]
MAENSWMNNHREEPTKSLSPEQIVQIRNLWNSRGVEEIAREVGVSLETVKRFTKTHYLYFNYIRC